MFVDLLDGQEGLSCSSLPTDPIAESELIAKIELHGNACNVTNKGSVLPIRPQKCGALQVCSTVTGKGSTLVIRWDYNPIDD